MNAQRNTILVSAAIVAAVVAAGARRSASAATPRVDLAGTWVMNDSVSRTLNFDEGFGRPGGSRGGGPRFDRGPGGGPPPEGGSGREGRRGLGGGMRGPRSVTIAQTDSTVSFAASDTSAPVVVRTDGRSHKLRWLDGRLWDVTGQWTERGLAVERSTIDGPTIAETWTRTPAAPRIVVETEFSSDDMPRARKMRRAYDLAPAKAILTD